MKKLLILLFLAPLMALAQNGKYITHTVAAKESLSSIGRLYNINPRELAKYNNIDYEKGLSLGQVLKVPNNGKTKIVETPTVAAAVKETKAPAKTTTVSTQGTTPIYHTVAKKETLYHISTLYNKVPIANIKKWNNLTSDGLNEGARLIVGYTNSPAAEEIKTTPVISTPVVKTEPVKQPETPKPTPVTEPVKVPEVKTVASTQVLNGKLPEGGVFKNAYVKASGKSEETGMAGIFKSTSGWEDGKYYCLHNSATAGSIVKITNNATKKSVYARVLDVMPDLKQNDGLILRLSNAAAEELGAGSGNFECVVTF